MRFAGRTFRSGRFWAAEVPILDVVTQGHSLADAHRMIADAVESLVGLPDFKARVYGGAGGVFEVGASNEALLTALLLRRARVRSGLSLAQVAARLGAKSVNSYARYEQGRSIPSVTKLSQLYAAVGLKADFVLIESGV
ncbi:MAG: helix-turn-helix transcriptional regulator [Candidatus Aminicenantes bacterium]|nr:helix-turn-helix transcriptional regulator [Candidatus Aminicenantes bacterium]